MQKNTVENLIYLVAGILLFNGIVNLPIVGKYFTLYPWIIVGVAIVLIIYKDKIAAMFGGK